MKKINEKNKLAWEQAYERSPDTYKNIADGLRYSPKEFLNQLFEKAVEQIELKDKQVAQLACNNGREILAIQRVYGCRSVHGFDIAENMIKDARKTATILNQNAYFHAVDVIEIDTSFNNSFDVVVIMIGALVWFQDLNDIIGTASRLLKSNGHLIIVDGHPLTWMFAFEGESNYDKSHPFSLQNDYFKKTPFIDNDGMPYMDQGNYESNPFISFSYTFEDVILSCIHNQLQITNFKESNLNLLESFPELHEKHIPLTFMLVGKKQ